MDLRQLEYFVRVAELGSFTKAAVALDVAQPALSRQVRLLEVELRQSLLTRNGRGAIPSDSGQLSLEQAARALAAVRLLGQRAWQQHRRGSPAPEAAAGDRDRAGSVGRPLTHGDPNDPRTARPCP
jgi:LysR family nitrogen assimilation transcriptional regulator